MDKIKILEEVRKDIGVGLPRIMIEASKAPFKLDHKGTVVGSLDLRACILTFKPDPDFAEHSYIIDDFIKDKDFIDVVERLCGLILGAKKNSTEIRISRKTYTALTNHNIYEQTLSALKSTFGNVVFKVEGD